MFICHYTSVGMCDPCQIRNLSVHTGTDTSFAPSSGKTRLNPQEVTALLSDKLFLGYNKAILRLGRVLRRFGHWLEACPCHVPHLADATSACKKAIALAFPLLGRCPNAGNRAPELAAGALNEIIKQLLDNCIADVMELVGDASAATKDTIMADLQHASSHLILGLEVKFACFSRLPWKLCAVAHHNVNVARVAAKTCIELFQEAEAQGFDLSGSQHHAVTSACLQGLSTEVMGGKYSIES